MELFFKEFGAGPPVVVVHGLFGFSDNWQTVAKSLAETNTVFTVDLRNHGRSPRSDRHDYAAIADDLREFLEKNWLFRASLVGHSMGGKAVMQFALMYPDMVEKLAVIDMAPKKYVGGHDDIFEALFSVELSSLSSRSEAEAILSVQVPDLGTRQFLMKNLTRTPDGSGFDWKMNLPVLFREYPKILGPLEADAPFDGPALFVRGGKSGYVSDKDFQAAKKLFPAAVLETIAGAGHWIHADRPTELLSLLKPFLS